MLSKIAVKMQRLLLLVRWMGGAGTAFLVSGLAFGAPAAVQSEWVHLTESGRLYYKSDARGNRIPDFSNVGYHGGGVPLPEPSVNVTAQPGSGEAGAKIQAAIEEVSKLPLDANGFRGAVLL